MNIAFFLTLAVFSALLTLSTVAQILYVESLRLRSREVPALEYFKNNLEHRLGLKIERGALTFSLIKHALIAMMGICALALLGEGRQQFWTAIAEAAVLAWALSMVFAQILPQLLYRKTNGNWLFGSLPVLHAMILVMAPIVAILKFFQSLTELRESADEENGNGTHSESVEALITAGKEEGLIEEEDRKLIQSVVEFGDKTVGEVMTPRPRIVGIEKSRSLEELRELVINEQYSRIPVYDETIDNVVGFIHVRDLFERNPNERGRKAWEIMRPIRVVPEQKMVTALLKEMQRDGAHMAVVVDEYGNTAGLATMEDLVEEIFGEIRDEHEPVADVTADGEGAWLVSGSFDLDHLQELVGFRPDEQFDSTTVGGLAAEWLGRVPLAGEAVEREGIRIEIVAADDRRVDRVRILRALEPEQPHKEHPTMEVKKDA
ncbi:MAG: HlyC/CorC family transporter [Bryobacterales bacterium]|nr:HlyC/CorC family transporter [Bryobacterales bacterium]